MERIEFRMLLLPNFGKVPAPLYPATNNMLLPNIPGNATKHHNIGSVRIK